MSDHGTENHHNEQIIRSLHGNTTILGGRIPPYSPHGTMPVRKNSLAGEIGQRLRRIRQERGGGRGKQRLTIEQLAGVAEVSPDFLNKVELGLHLPGADVLVRLARALDVHPGELLPDVGISAEKRAVLHELQAFASQFPADEIRHLVTVARAVLGPTMPRMPAAPQSRQRRPRRVDE